VGGGRQYSSTAVADGINTSQSLIWKTSKMLVMSGLAVNPALESGYGPRTSLVGIERRRRRRGSSRRQRCQSSLGGASLIHCSVRSPNCLVPGRVGELGERLIPSWIDYVPTAATSIMWQSSGCQASGSAPLRSVFAHRTRGASLDAAIGYTLFVMSLVSMRRESRHVVVVRALARLRGTSRSRSPSVGVPERASCRGDRPIPVHVQAVKGAGIVLYSVSACHLRRTDVLAATGHSVRPAPSRPGV